MKFLFERILVGEFRLKTWSGKKLENVQASSDSSPCLQNTCWTRFFSVSRFLPVGWIISNVLVSSTAMKYSLPTFESENYLETLTIKILWQLFQLFVFTAAITCPGLPSPRNGTRLGCSGNATEFYDTVCQFGCNNGYVGSGSHIRRCQENETWSGEEFICQSTSNLVVMLENVALDFFSLEQIRKRR